MACSPREVSRSASSEEGLYASPPTPPARQQVAIATDGMRIRGCYQRGRSDCAMDLCKSPARASAVVGELERHVEVGGPQQPDHRLEVVLLLRTDSQLVALNVGLNALGALVADPLGDRPGLVRGDPLFDPGRHLVRPAGRLRLAGVQCLERDAPLD